MRSTNMAWALLALGWGLGCGHDPQPRPVAPKVSTPPPAGPTRTDFRKLAKRLVRRCIGGGWIAEWRSEHEDVDVARPRVRLRAIDDQTGQGLDPSYLGAVLEKRMRRSGVFDVAAAGGADPVDFEASVRILRLSEVGKKGRRFAVYSAIMQLSPAAGGRPGYSCEASVRE